MVNKSTSNITDTEQGKQENLSCWIITEGIAGTENQCIGVAQALGAEYSIKRINLRQPWKSLSPMFAFETACSFTGDTLEPEDSASWPDIILCSGRKSIAAARYIRKTAPTDIFIAYIQDPRTNAELFNLIAVPKHDKMRGDNVIVTQGAPNKITLNDIDNAAKSFAPTVENLPDKKIAVLIGGNSKAYSFDHEIATQLIDNIKSLAEQGYGIMVTASRRTGEDIAELLRTELTHPNIYFWDGTGENPYFGFLGLADYILVTADSASMLSEAATTGKPVFMIPLKGGTKKFDVLHKNLVDYGCIKIFDGTIEDYSYEPLHDAECVAVEITKRLSAKQ